MIFVAAALPMSLALIGWVLGRNDYVDRAKEVAQVAAPLLPFVGFVVAAFVAYSTWLSPFEVAVQTRPIVWRIGPGTFPPNTINVVAFVTLFNRGATPGAVNDFLLEIEFPNGKWRLETWFFANSERFYQSLLRPDVPVPFDAGIVEGPFTPIYLPGRTQVSKAVGFSRALANADFNPALLQAGTHPLRLYARYNMGDKLTRIYDGTIIFEDAALVDLRNGRTIAGELRQGDRPLRDLARDQ